jgi:hypothetical protein
MSLLVAWMGQSWRTTLLGVLTIVGGVATALTEYLRGQTVNVPALAATVTAGMGLIHAKDNKVLEGKR